ncbi:hypothetical protein EWM64_g1845 [Hericium alpestre]|uniref:Protein kinase domain-containing protein n=1 Tax=Hericium alpestre TaxID=135208 RepID=A0A4Z0A605_9AGAM|nr:hypothetical protein EWM64_g1845 [Hericium alpestre]
MHENFVAHRDCGSLNIMMDASQMYPQSFHPVKINKSRDFRGRARLLTRTECKPRYYLIDFGLSMRYDPQSGNWPPSERKVYGVDKSVPEYRDMDGLHNPFPTDVYYIGNLIREHFLQRFKGLSFFDQLISRMVQNDPNLRPPMYEVAEVAAGKAQRIVVARCWRLCAHIMRARYFSEDIGFIPLPDVHVETAGNSFFTVWLRSTKSLFLAGALRNFLIIPYAMYQQWIYYS